MQALLPPPVSVAFVIAGGASPVVDDQGDADQGEQHPQAQEKGGLQQGDTSYCQRVIFRHFLHVLGGRRETSALTHSVPPVFVTTVAELSRLSYKTG